MDGRADNAYCAQFFEGESGYEIIACAQAVGAVTDAYTFYTGGQLLNAAFGNPDSGANPWTNAGKGGENTAVATN